MDWYREHWRRGFRRGRRSGGRGMARRYHRRLPRRADRPRLVHSRWVRSRSSHRAALPRIGHGGHVTCRMPRIAMLSEQSRPVVVATLPIVGEHIGEIASRFYRRLFAEHPELLDGVFNRGNQARGEQQRSLAGSVASFAAALVETPERTPVNLLR